MKAYQPQYKIPFLYHTLSWYNPTRIFTTCFSNTSFNIILHIHLHFPNTYFCWDFLTNTLSEFHVLLHMQHVTPVSPFLTSLLYCLTLRFILSMKHLVLEPFRSVFYLQSSTYIHIRNKLKKEGSENTWRCNNNDSEAPNKNWGFVCCNTG
jgi:hypothetical protein